MSSASSKKDGISKQSQEDKLSVDNIADSRCEESKVINPGDSSSIDATDFLKDMRRKARENLLGPPDRDVSNERDLKYMIKIVRGLITINAEIWGRCEDHMAFSRPPGFQIEKAEHRNARMMRLTYEEAQVKASDKSFYITAKKSLQYKDFGPAPSMPSSLTDFVASRPFQEDDDRQIFYDYKEYLGRAALLEDDVLLPFLQKLQTHLEEVQCYVGEIEEWLAESNSILVFLNDLFDKELEIGSIGYNWKVRCDDANPVCFNCFYPSHTHIYSGSHRHSLCAKNCRKLSASSRTPKYYSPPTPDVLFKARMGPGIMGLSFDLCSEDGRSKLEAFSTFVERFKEEEEVDKEEDEVSDDDENLDEDEVGDEDEVDDKDEDGDESESVHDVWDDVKDENEDEEQSVFEDEYDNNDY
uniref:Uncharacterized protein n=1 Tax=Chaetoceros debilis TaxID=122233 RepID=A0A7S3QE95_9STRA|mmetsp:Transcript_2352/g.3503  ORF Transcript_2352/g.3503 Transcript_2352/m.3503 type:complete len:413 (-) Transcript_2352:31-1269(-)